MTNSCDIHWVKITFNHRLTVTLSRVRNEGELDPNTACYLFTKTQTNLKYQRNMEHQEQN